MRAGLITGKDLFFSLKGRAGMVSRIVDLRVPLNIGVFIFAVVKNKAFLGDLVSWRWIIRGSLNSYLLSEIIAALLFQ
jgi:hypothetical protein